MANRLPDHLLTDPDEDWWLEGPLPETAECPVHGVEHAADESCPVCVGADEVEEG